MGDDADKGSASAEAGGAPSNRDRRLEPGVIEGEVVRSPGVAPAAAAEAHPEAANAQGEAAAGPIGEGETTTAPQQGEAEAAAPKEPPASPPHREWAPPPPPPASRLGAILSGGLGGLLVAALAIAALWSHDPRADATRDLADRLAAVDARVHALDADSAANTPRLAAAVKAAADAAALGARVESGSKSLSERVAKLEAALAAPKTEVRADQQEAAPAAPDLSPLSARLDKLEATLTALASAPRPEPPKPPDLSGVLGRLDKVEAALAAPKTEPRTGDAAALAVVAEALNEKLTTGAPYLREFDALTRLGADLKALAALKPFAEKGARTAAALDADFAALAPDLAAAIAPPDEGGVIDKLWSHMRGLVRVRKVGEVAGDDPEALLSQAEVAAAHGDVAGALARVGRLPDKARAVAKDWMGKAAARVAADAALQSVRESALAHLAEADK